MQLQEIKDNPKLEDEENIWTHFLIASVKTGYSLTPIFVWEFYRLAKIFLDSQKNSTNPDFKNAYEKDITKVFKLAEEYVDPNILPKDLWKIAQDNMDLYLKLDFPDLFNSK